VEKVKKLIRIGSRGQFHYSNFFDRLSGGGEVVASLACSDFSVTR
jgi:hypothetical protein